MLPSMSKRVPALKPLSCVAQVVGLLAGEARDVLLALQVGAMALHAVELGGQFLARLDCRCVGLRLMAGGAGACAEK